MIDIGILGSSGYIGSCLRKHKLSNGDLNKYTFYSKRRGNESKILYTDSKEIKNHDVILDFSQRATCQEISSGCKSEEFKRIENCALKCKHYILASTANINRNKTLSLQNNPYTQWKVEMEEWLTRSIQNSTCIRFPVVFSELPKANTIINKLVKSGNGFHVSYNNQDALITAIHTEDLFSTLEKSINYIMEGKIRSKSILISEQRMYAIKYILEALSKKYGVMK